MNEEQLSDLSKSLASRAKRARRSAWYSAVLIIITVFSMITFFYGSGLYDRFALAELKYRLSDLSESSVKESPNNEAIPTELLAEKLKLDLAKAELDLKRAELDKAAEESSRLSSTITNSVTKVGAVLIAIYLVQILLGLMRYHFKLADHIETMSEALKISNDDIDKLEKITAVIGVAHIDFGKSPQTPVDKLAEIIKDLSGHVASLKKSSNN